MMTTRKRNSFLALAMLIASTAYAAPGEWRFGVGAEYSSGDYGTSTTTDIWYFPFSLTYRTDDAAFAVTVPWIIIEGTGNVVPNGTGSGVHRGNATSQRRRDSGLGDLVASAATPIAAETPARPRIEVMGKIKFGTADADRNLGTGENDYSVQFNFDQQRGAELLFGSVGYKVPGEPPGVHYDDALFGSIGFQHRLREQLSAGVELFGEQAIAPGSDGPLDVTLYLAQKQSSNAKLAGYLRIGLSNSSPDHAVGVSYGRAL